MQTAMLVRVNGELKCIPFEDVLFINAKDKYCEIVTVEKKKWLTLATISYMQQKLPQNLFLRVHRSHIISLSKIDRVKCSHVEIAKEKIPISKVGLKEIEQRFLMICPEFDRKLRKEMEAMDAVQYVKKVKTKKNNIH